MDGIYAGLKKMITVQDLMPGIILVCIGPQKLKSLSILIILYILFKIKVNFFVPIPLALFLKYLYCSS